jgi:uncharacterized protein with PIN domain
MSIAWFRFYEELNDFLPSARKKLSFSTSFTGNPSVKDVIESLGVPHPEIDLILVNGQSVNFNYKLMNEDQVSVYPVFESFDISGASHLRAKPLRETKFICDVHLGRLAKYLRLTGFDTNYSKDYGDIQIIGISVNEKRIILTRDRGLLKNRQVTHGYWIRSAYPREQFVEVVEKFDLRKNFKPFSRCLECNGILVDVSKDDVISQLLPKTRQYSRAFKKCPVCERIFWEGSHYEKMKNYIEKILNS